MTMTSKQRAFLKGLAMNLDTILSVGKESMTEGFRNAVEEALEANELVKIGVLKNCADDPKEIAVQLSEETKSEVVQVIGKKIVLFRTARKEEHRKIKLPKAKETKNVK